MGIKRNKNHNKHAKGQRGLNMPDMPTYKPVLHIAEDIDKKVIAHLPDPDEGVEPRGSEIRTKRRPWDFMSPGKLVASYDGRR